MQSFPQLMTVHEAATALRIGKNSCYELVRTHRIPSLRIGRRILIPGPALARWVEEQSESTSYAEVVEFPASERHQLGG